MTRNGFPCGEQLCLLGTLCARTACSCQVRYQKLLTGYITGLWAARLLSLHCALANHPICSFIFFGQYCWYAASSSPLNSIILLLLFSVLRLSGQIGLFLILLNCCEYDFGFGITFTRSHVRITSSSLS